MGLLVADTLVVSRFGVSISNFYVTIRSTYRLVKGRMPPFSDSLYTITAEYYIFTSQESGALEPILKDTVMVGSEVFPENPVQLIYTQLKNSIFQGMTVTDDM